jgi:hypothetical protein
LELSNYFLGFLKNISKIMIGVPKKYHLSKIKNSYRASKIIKFDIQQVFNI